MLLCLRYCWNDELQSGGHQRSLYIQHISILYIETDIHEAPTQSTTPPCSCRCPTASNLQCRCISFLPARTASTLLRFAIKPTTLKGTKWELRWAARWGCALSRCRSKSEMRIHPRGGAEWWGTGGERDMAYCAYCAKSGEVGERCDDVGTLAIHSVAPQVGLCKVVAVFLPDGISQSLQYRAGETQVGKNVGGIKFLNPDSKVIKQCHLWSRPSYYRGVI